MTVQAQSTPMVGTTHRPAVRGMRGWVIGFVALAAAGTGIGFAVSGNDTAAPAGEVIAPATEVNPNAEQRDAFNRVQQPAAEPEVVWYLPGKPGIK